MRVDLKSMRLKRGLSQGELSQKSGVPQPMISEIENGVARYPQINTLYKLADALRCSVEADPKTEAGVRDIPLVPALRAVLKGHDGLLLPGPDGKPCTETAFSRAWESYNNALSRAVNGGVQRRWWGRTKEHKARLAKREELLAAGLKAEADAMALPPYREINLRCHDFRHTYCTNLCSAGVDLHVAIGWLGHADEKMIMQIYDHVTPARIQTAVKNLEAYFT